jgi:hypothetical protein
VLLTVFPSRCFASFAAFSFAAFFSALCGRLASRSAFSPVFLSIHACINLGRIVASVKIFQFFVSPFHHPGVGNDSGGLRVSDTPGGNVGQSNLPPVLGGRPAGASSGMAGAADPAAVKSAHQVGVG